MKKLFLLFFFVAIAGNIPATTIVIYITPEFAIMAVDSKGVFTNAKTYQKTNTVVSKIFQTGNVYFSLAGLTSNNLHNFDIGRITHTNLKKASNLKDGIDSIKLNVKAALYRYLTNQKKSNYTLFRKNIEDDIYITSIGIIAIKNNRPYAHILGFKVADGKELKVSVVEDFYPTNSTKDAVYYLGTSGEINNYMNRIDRNNLKPVPFVDRLMQLQINRTPDRVGYPIDIIKLTSNSARWIRRKKTTPVQYK